MGFSSEVKPPVKINIVPRRIPPQPWYNEFVLQFPACGALIFATICIEFSYVMDSVWNSYMYAMFGFLYVNLFLMAAVIAMLAIVSVYLQVSNGDWAWWWKTFLLGASGGMYVGPYALYFLLFHMDARILSIEMVFNLWYLYCFMVIYCTMCGTIAVFAGYMFLKTLYGQAKKYD